MKYNKQNRVFEIKSAQEFEINPDKSFFKD